MAEKLKIAVVGAGGVGGYLTAKLIQKRLADVKLFARGEHLEAITKNGLQVVDEREVFTVHPDTTQPASGIVFDVVFLAVKSYDFKSACESVKKYIDAQTLVIPLSNGVGHKEEIAQYLHTGLFCDGCVYIISHVKGPGVIAKIGTTFYLIFGCNNITPKMKTLEELLNQSGLKTRLSDSAAYDCWKKYLFISTFASLTAFYALPMNEVWYRYPDEVRILLSEIKKVANAMDIPIGDEDVARVVTQAENLPLASKTSMQLDFEAGKKTELDSLSGYIVRMGEKYGVKTPLMHKLYEALRKKEKAS